MKSKSVWRRKDDCSARRMPLHGATSGLRPASRGAQTALHTFSLGGHRRASLKLSTTRLEAFWGREAGQPGKRGKELGRYRWTSLVRQPLCLAVIHWIFRLFTGEAMNASRSWPLVHAEPNSGAIARRPSRSNPTRASSVNSLHGRGVLRNRLGVSMSDRNGARRLGGAERHLSTVEGIFAAVAYWFVRQNLEVFVERGVDRKTT